MRLISETFSIETHTIYLLSERGFEVYCGNARCTHNNTHAQSMLQWLYLVVRRNQADVWFHALCSCFRVGSGSSALRQRVWLSYHHSGRDLQLQLLHAAH